MAIVHGNEVREVLRKRIEELREEAERALGFRVVATEGGEPKMVPVPPEPAPANPRDKG